jgi:peptide chain release factor 2
MCWEVFFDLAKEKSRLSEIENISSQADFWNDADKARLVSKERAELQTKIDTVAALLRAVDDAETMFELCKDQDDDSLKSDCIKELIAAEKKLENYELTRMLSGQHDHENAILEINSGAGGTEAQDWGEMLLRMYLRWAEKRGFKAEVLSIHEGEGAGIKNATIYIEGVNAYGFLRSERGVHRLVRISPFDSNARRHTSFASVSAMPDIEDDVEVEVKEDDLRIDTYRSSGAGGQHVNKTDSAVRLTHIPTGIVVACQSDRSQHKNKATAMKLLKAKLYEVELDKQREELSKISGEKRKIEWGSQIRSYVMHPYQMVKDLRTDCETSAVQDVMDGGLDDFIRAYLLSAEYNIA